MSGMDSRPRLREGRLFAGMTEVGDLDCNACLTYSPVHFTLWRVGRYRYEEAARTMDDATSQYVKRMTIALLVYTAVLAASSALTSAYPDAIWRFPVAVAPMAPFVYAIAANVRYLSMVDELQQRMRLEALAIAFGSTAAITFCYGFLEHVGLPHINWWWVWPVMGTSWILGSIYTERRYR